MKTNSEVGGGVGSSFSGLVIYSEGYILILPALQKFEETQVQGINAETLNLFIDSLQD